MENSLTNTNKPPKKGVIQITISLLFIALGFIGYTAMIYWVRMPYSSSFDFPVDFSKPGQFHKDIPRLHLSESIQCFLLVDPTSITDEILQKHLETKELKATLTLLNEQNDNISRYEIVLDNDHTNHIPLGRSNLYPIIKIPFEDTCTSEEEMNLTFSRQVIVDIPEGLSELNGIKQGFSIRFYHYGTKLEQTYINMFLGSLFLLIGMTIWKRKPKNNR